MNLEWEKHWHFEVDMQNKFDGKISSFPGYEGGSIDLEVCLPPYSMRALETDEEFMDVVSLSH